MRVYVADGYRLRGLTGNGVRSNCVVFALTLYARRRRKGREGYLVMRRSRWGSFPHVLYAEVRNTGTLRVVSYVPKSPRHKPVPPLMFTGSSKWGDFSATVPNPERHE